MRKHRRDEYWILSVVIFLFWTTLLISMTVARSSSGGGPLDNRPMKKDRMDKYRQRMLRAEEENSVMSMMTSNSNANSNSNSNTNMMAVSASRKRYPPRPASVNSILRLDPSMSLWDDSTSICHTVPGLTKSQMELCFRSPDATKVALDGIQLATEECGHQMQKHRWNCSSLQNNTNPHSTHLLQKGYRESAFGHAISAAGVAYAVAKACSQGKLLSCGCGFQYDDQVNFVPSKDADYSFDESNEAIMNRQSDSSWKWRGCSHNMDYGLRFAKTFLDSREKSHDLPSRINLHNNKVGRMAVSENMDVKCKCHGLSGSCELRTCWKTAPLFRRVGTVLKTKFRRAIMIDQSELGNRPLNRVLKSFNKQRRKRRDRQSYTSKKQVNIDLWYYEKSPTYCDPSNDFNIPGTSGRQCNRTGGRDPGSCSTLCCGRGYNTIRQTYTQRCGCQFRWCCNVTCQTCEISEWVHVCK